MYCLPVEMQVRNASNTPEGDGFYASKNMERYGRILNMEEKKNESAMICILIMREKCRSPSSRIIMLFANINHR